MKRGFNGGMHHGGKKFHRQGTVVLTYFQSAGLAHYTRLLFTIGEVDFVDRRITQEEFAQKYKAYSPTGQLPMLEIGDETLVQSSAIALYAATRANLMPECPMSLAKAISIQSVLDELRSEAGVEGTKWTEPAERYKHLAPWFVNNFPRVFDLIKNIVDTIPATPGSPFIFGKMSFVDVALHSAFKTVQDWLGEELYNKLCAVSPRLTEAVKAVNELPATKKVLGTYTKPKRTLYYYAVDGRATPIRWALAYGNVECEEVTFSMEEWVSKYKAMAPTGRAPWMTITFPCGKVETIVETNAILGFVGSKCNLIPRNPADACHMYGVMQSADTVTDMMVSIWKLKHEKNEEEANKMVEHLNSGPLATALKRLEEQLKIRHDHTGYVVNGRLTIGDLAVAGMFRFVNGRHNGLVVPDLWTAYPQMLKVYKRVMMHPEFQNTLKAHVARPTFHYFDFNGRDMPIRFMLKHANIDSTWVTFNDNQWASEFKKVSVTGKAPYMDVNGKLVHECYALNKYVAERAGLIPHLMEHRVQADSIFSVYNNLFPVLSSVYAYAEGEARQTYLQSRIPDFEAQLDIVEKLAATTASTEGYLVENHLTWIDFYVAGELDWVVTRGWIKGHISDKWPTLGKTYKMIFALPCALRAFNDECK